MNRRIAALHLAGRHPDFDTLAANMGKRPDTLRKELTKTPGYKWGVDDEDLLMDLCQALKVEDALAPLTAFAANRGALLVALPSGLESDSPTMQCLAAAAKEFGDFMSTAAAAMADNQVTANEVRAIEKKFGKLVAVGQGALTSMIAVHEAGKPAARTHKR